MSFVQIMLNRVFSKNPKLFSILSWIAGLIALIGQIALIVDNRIEEVYFTEGLRGLLNDTVLTCIGIFTTANLTTSNKNLQQETDKLLEKK